MIAARVLLAVAALNLLFLFSELALNVFKASFGWKGESMLAHTAFSLAEASPSQMIAFFGGAVVTIAFFIWVAYLVREWES
jgi:hypothetical protein